jgi:hypothetical protein
MPAKACARSASWLSASHRALGVAQRQAARAERGFLAVRREQRGFQQAPQRGEVDVFVLHAGEREQVVAAEVAHMFQRRAERADQPIGGALARFAAADQVQLQLFGQRGRERFGGEQGDRQQAHRAVGVGGLRFQRLRRHAALVGAEGDHIFQMTARHATRQFVERGPHREARTQQLHRVEQRAGHGEPRLGGGGHQRLQVGGDVRGQFGRFVAGERAATGRVAGAALDREHHGQGEQGRAVQGERPAARGIAKFISAVGAARARGAEPHRTDGGLAGFPGAAARVSLAGSILARMF